MKLRKLLSMLLSAAMAVSMASAVTFAAEGAAHADVILIAAPKEIDGSLLDPVTKGSFRDEKAAPRYASVQNESVDGREIADDVSWHNGVIYDEAGEWTINDTTITMMTDADGSDTNDFSGLGAAVMVNGEGVLTTISHTKIETSGVAKLALFTDNGAVTIVDDSEMYAYGGIIYDGYMSTADQSVMVSPPWVLGLGGNADAPCNARTTNLMGDYSVAAYVDSYFYAEGWGALSVDSGTNMNMVIVNSDVDVETSGYGAYNIGNSTETYYGSTMDVSTYAIIMTGGEATFTSYTGGQEVDVVRFGGETNEYGHGVNGAVVAKVSSDKVTGTRTSSIVSDDFGFMCHNNGPSGWNVVNVIEGTSVTTGDAIFLVKKVEAVFNVDNAVLESGNNTIVQIIDNDDDYVGLDFTAEWGEDNGYGHAFGAHMPTFNAVFTEEAGYSNEWIAATAAAGRADYDTASNWTVAYNMTNTEAQGDLWNSSGYVGANPATTMNVNLGEGAVLTGVISAGAFSHTTKYAEVGSGDWTAADALGHVTNIANSNGVNLVNVVLTDDAAWVVTGDSIVTSLTAANSAVTAEKAVTITVEGALTLDGKVVTGTKTVGNVTYVVKGFSDVDEGEYYYDAVLWAVENRVTTGTGDGTTFSPDEDCTRGQIMTFLWRASGSPTLITDEVPFTDVDTGSYYGDAVLWAVEEGITTGANAEGTTFQPGASCTRGQIVTFLWRAAGCPEPTAASCPFTDVDEDAYYYDAVLWAVEKGITTGTGDGTTFSPDSDCDRGQIVTFLYRYFGW